MKLNEARSVVEDSVLHVGSDTYSPEKRDRAIKYACKRFIRETNCSVQLADFPISSGDTLVDISNKPGLSDFIRDQFLWAHLSTDQEELRLVPYRSLIRRQNNQGTTGTPTHISWADEKQAYFYPGANKAYTVRMERRRPLVTWESGTDNPGAVTLNIPEEWIEDVLWTGAKFALIGGAPGPPDSNVAGQRFDLLIAEAKAHFTAGDAGMADRISNPTLRLTSAEPTRKTSRRRRG